MTGGGAALAGRRLPHSAGAAPPHAPSPPASRARRPLPARFWVAAAAAIAVALLLVIAFLVALTSGPVAGTPTAPPAVLEIVAPPTSGPTPSPAGSNRLGRILFSSTTEDGVELSVIHLPGGEIEPFTRFSGHKAWTSDLSAGGSRIGYFVAYPPDSSGDLFLLDTRGTWQAPVLEDWDQVSFLDLSPDGDLVAFTNKVGNVRDIFVVDADGSGLANLTEHPQDDSQPSWSPKGNRIAFVSRRDGKGDLYVMKAGGDGVTRLTYSEDAPYAGPAWAPDGKRIAFLAGGEYPNYDMYLVEADGGGLQRIVDWPEADGSPSYPQWSPDGQTLAFHAKKDGNKDLYTVRSDGSDLTRLTDHPADARSPRWSPDGTQLAFRSDRAGDFDIYIMDAGGSGLTRLTDAPGDEWALAWLP